MIKNIFKNYFKCKIKKKLVDKPPGRKKDRPELEKNPGSNKEQGEILHFFLLF